MSSAIVETVIRWCEMIADDPNYYYSQDGNKRWGTVSSSTPPYYYDCSSFVTTAFSLYAGYDYTANHTAYTGTMYSILTRHNFRDVTSTGVIQWGDVLLNHNDDHQHTCIYTSNTPTVNREGVSKIVVAAQNTRLGINKDINDTNHYDYILRFTGSFKWYAKSIGGYLRTSNEAFNNANMIYSALFGKGWTLNAVCGVLGNMEYESGYNPWRWEGDIVLASTDPQYKTSLIHGYGLGQFTPAGKYIDHAQNYRGYKPKFSDTTGSPDDGNAQILFINDHADYIPTSSYPQSYSEYKTTTQPPEWCARAWFYNYERGTWNNARIDAANYWYEKLQGAPPHPVYDNLPWWLLKKCVDNLHTILTR